MRLFGFFQIAEVLFPMAEFVSIELNRIQGLEAREVVVRTLSAQGESQDSPVAAIPNSLLVPLHPQPLPHPHPHPHALPHPHPHTLPHPQPHSQPHPQPHPHTHPHTLPHPQPHLPPHPLHPLHPIPAPQPRPPASAGEPQTKEEEAGLRMGPPWDPPPPGLHTLDTPRFPGRRSPSPQRILPQPRGAPIPDTVAKAIAREAAQRVAAESGRVSATATQTRRFTAAENNTREFKGPHACLLCF